MPRRCAVEGIVAFRVGQWVRSRAGRDRGADLLVVAVLDDRHVLVADGRLRRVENPKRKNVRHLEVLGAARGELATRFAAGEAIGDGEIRRALTELLVSEEAHD